MTPRLRGAAIAVLLLLIAPPASRAHGRLVSSTPAEDERLTAPPRELPLTFSERPELAVSAIELHGPGGALVRLGALRAGERSPLVLVADVLDTLRRGTYEVRWRVAGADGHPVRGSYRFEIVSGLTTGARASADSAPAPAVAESAIAPEHSRFDAESPAYVLIRWLGYAALVLTIGAVSFAVYVLPRTWTAGDDLSSALLPAARERVRRLAMTGAVALLITAGFRLPAQMIAMFGPVDALDHANVAAVLADTLWGAGWILQLGAALLLLAVLSLARTHHRLGWTVALLVPPALALASAIAGHAAALEEHAPLTVGLDALHVLAVSTWIGGLAALVFAGLPAAAELPLPAGRASAALVNAFSPVALVSGALVVLTGAAQGALQLGSFDALTGSTYGRVLLIKVAAVALALGAGAFSWRRVRPLFATGDATARLRRSGGAELLASLLVLLATAVLVALPTPR